MATTKEELLVLGIILHVVIVMCCRGTSVARSLKLLALPYPLSKNQSIENNIILSTNRSYVISPCETNIIYIPLLY